MAEKSPEHGLSRSGTGWYKRIRGKWTWVVGANIAPSGADADDFYVRHIKRFHPESGEAKPRDRSVVTVGDLCDEFIQDKRLVFQAGDIEDRTLADWRVILQFVLATIGDKPARKVTATDFAKLAVKWADRAPSTRRRFFLNVRSLFKWGAAELDIPMPSFGEAFRPPGRKVMRRAKAEKQARVGIMAFRPEQVMAQLAGGTMIRKNGKPMPVRLTPALRAMVLLGVNAGFGNIDCGSIPNRRDAIDLDAGWVTFPRPKTGAQRRAKLWPETVEAIRAWLKVRPKPAKPEHANLLFLTGRGMPYVRKRRHREDWVERRDKIAPSYRNLLKHLKQHRPGLGFNSLRRTCRSIGAETAEEMVLDVIMGHAEDANDMGAVYTRWLLDGKFERVSEHIRQRVLFGAKGID